MSDTGEVDWSYKTMALCVTASYRRLFPRKSVEMVHCHQLDSPRVLFQLLSATQKESVAIGQQRSRRQLVVSERSCFIC